MFFYKTESQSSIVLKTASGLEDMINEYSSDYPICSTSVFGLSFEKLPNLTAYVSQIIL